MAVTKPPILFDNKLYLNTNTATVEVYLEQGGAAVKLRPVKPAYKKVESI